MARLRRMKLAALRCAAAGLALQAAVQPAWSALPAPGAPVRPDQSPAVEELLRAARLWQSLGGADEERNLLRKVLSVRESEPRALFMLAQLEWRSGHPEAAQRALALLQESARPAYGAAPLRARLLTELRAMSRVYEGERDRLAQLRLVIRGGGRPRAQALARALFPDGRPPGDLANEFSDVLADTPSGWLAMRDLFRRRLQSDPGNGPDRLSYFELLARHDASLQDAIAGLAQLSRATDVDAKKVQDAWRDALDRLGHDDASQQARRRFLDRYPQDPGMLAQYREAAARASAEGAAGRKAQQTQLAHDSARAKDPVLLGLQAAQRELDAGHPDAALEHLAQVRRLDPHQPEAIGMEGLVAFRQGRYAEALAAFQTALAAESGDAEHAARWRDLVPAAQYWGALADARAALDAGDLARAQALVAEARQRQPDQAEAVYLQAEILYRQGRPDAAKAVYRSRLEEMPGDLRAWRGLLSLLLNQDGIESGLAEAARAGTRGLDPASLLDAGDIRTAIRVGTAAHPDAALRLLEQAVALLPDDPWLRFDLARRYADLALPQSATEVMDQGVSRRPDDPDMVYAAALVASSDDRYDAALALLGGISRDRWSPGMLELDERDRFETALAHARVARQADPKAEPGWRARARDLCGAEANRWLRVIGADLAAEDVSGARSDLDALARFAPALDAGQRLRLVALMTDAGRLADALVELDGLQGSATADGASMVPWWMARARVHRAGGNQASWTADLGALDGILAPDAVELRLAVMDLMATTDPAMRDWLARLQAARPDDPGVKLALAAQAHREDRDNLAMRLLGALDADPLAAPIRDGVASLRGRILAQQKTWVESALERDARQASPGTSSLSLEQIPLRVVWPHDYESQGFVQVDALRLDAGMLPATLADTAAWGSLLVHPIGPTGLPAPLDVTARGVSLEAGWRAAQRRWDLGISGAGLPVPNLVGGWREDWTLPGKASLSAEWSRRALTGSLLAFAGATDPASGQKWGGAVDNAFTLRWSRDLQDRWDVAASLQIGDITGRHLPSNLHEQVRSVIERDWIARPDFRLNAGAVLNLWHYARNESFFTLGQGGYYSPQAYVSIGLPVQATGRLDRWSYDLRLTPSRSSTHEQATPAFPVDGGLQALSGNLLLGGGAGGGWALSARADLEYLIGRHGAVGAWVDLDRSSYYAPTRVMFYLRYQVDPPMPGRPDFPPRPPVPISRY